MVFQISLKESDGDHLEKLKEDLDSEHKLLRNLINKNGYNQNIDESKSCKFSVANKKFVECLMQCGVNPNKTFDCKFPSEDIVPEHLIRHFIRGFFDGDGSVYNVHDSLRHPNRKDTLRMSFTGTLDMLSAICKILNSVAISNASVRKYPDKDVYDLKYGGKNIMNRIYHYLYDDSTIYLQRKYDIFFRYFN